MPEQKETHHLIQMLRKESNSGALDDLAHVSSRFCLADPLTKASALADELAKAVNTGILPEVDIHPPFRELLQHKAFLIEWLIVNIENVATAVAFLGTDIGDIQNVLLQHAFLNTLWNVCAVITVSSEHCRNSG